MPFCAIKCSYCAFYSEAASGALVNRYVAALIRELELVASDLKPGTIFFGGGTPSLLNLRQWEQVLNAMERLNLLGAAEWTVECNPATVSLDKARLLKSAGVNRLSMGVQSLNSALLERLGRVHTRQMVFTSFDTLRKAGFDNVNLDLMFAIPGQTLEIWRETLAEATAMGSEHLSSYEVTYEEDTPLLPSCRPGRSRRTRTWPAPCMTSWSSAPQRPASRDTRCPTSRATTQPARGPLTAEHPGLCLPPQCELLARWLVLRAGPERDQLRPGRPHEELVQHAALLRAARKRPPGHRVARGVAAAGASGGDGGLRPADGRRLAVRTVPKETGHDLRDEWAADMARLSEQGWGASRPAGSD